ncbi:MAG: (d)CMP kinase [Bryobacteraceae bacterium]|nr:(d)CMP kinase [Bryobacteraceae bacterium]
MKRIIVAIDGPGGAGKSTIARRVAERLGYLYLDTGAMYRAVALWALRTQTSLDDMHRLEQLALSAAITFEDCGRRVLLNGEDISASIRTPEVSAAASKVSAVPGVRRALVEKQREAARSVSVVMEGRDIGTVVFPDAEVKFFLDASPEVRAARRVKELEDRNGGACAESVARELAERDARDRTRAEAPLVQAPDAMYLDSSALTPEEVEERILKTVRDRTANGKEVAR